MTAVRRDGEHVVIEFEPTESAVLADLTGQLRELLGSDDPDDAALARLFPDAYPDDGLASAEFRRYTDDGLRDAKLAQLALIAEMLGTDELERFEDDGAATATVILPPDAAERWLRALNDLRLTIGARIGLSDDDQEVEEHELGGLYHWLTQLQWAIIESLDAIEDARAGRGA